MQRLRLILFIAVMLLGLMAIPGHRRIEAQGTAPPLVPEKAGSILGEEMDPEFMEILDLLEDSELIEILISDTDFLDVLEEFGEDIGIGEEEIPFELLEEGNAFSKVEESVESGETFEDAGERKEGLDEETK